MKRSTALAGASLLALGLCMAGARADIAVTANDSHSVQENGVIVAAKDAPPDSISLIDMAQNPPKIVATVEVPASVVGPPSSIVIAPDQSFAIVTSSTRLDPKDATKIVPDDRVSVIDLKSSPPKVLQTVSSGAGAAGVALSPDGSLVIVANREEGSVSTFTLKDKKLEPGAKLDLGSPKGLPSAVSFLPDGKTVLLTRYNDHMVSVLTVDGTKLTLDPRPITTGLSPYTLDVARDGSIAIVANMGRGNGDADTVSLIDLTQKPFRTVQTVSVGMSPEGVKLSPDGKLLAVAAIDGSNKATGSPFRRETGTLLVMPVENKRIGAKLAEGPIGRWSQGVAFSKDGATIVVGSMNDRALNTFRWEGGKLTPGQPVAIGAGPVAISTPWP